jgi:hypothetical protein
VEELHLQQPIVFLDGVLLFVQIAGKVNRIFALLVVFRV